jgi:hypothetical protein
MELLFVLNKWRYLSLCNKVTASKNRPTCHKELVQLPLAYMDLLKVDMHICLLLTNLLLLFNLIIDVIITEEHYFKMRY